MSKQAPLVTINFAVTDYRLVSRIRSVLIVLVVALCGLSVVLFGLNANSRSQLSAVAHQVQALEASEAKVLPALQEREQLTRNLGEMASLIEARRFSWTRLLTAIEEVFPSGVALNRLEFDPRERVVALEGEARSPEALSALMIGLQRTAILKNPLLKRQSMEKGTLSFHVTVNYQETLASGPSPGAVRRAGR
jgi:Tfp pilus assembly protein PilN